MKPHRHSQLWSDTETRELIQVLQQRMPIAHIAEQHQRTESAIRAMRQKLAYTYFIREKMTIGEIATRLGYTTKEVETDIRWKSGKMNYCTQTARSNACLPYEHPHPASGGDHIRHVGEPSAHIHFSDDGLSSTTRHTLSPVTVVNVKKEVPTAAQMLYTVMQMSDGSIYDEILPELESYRLESVYEDLLSLDIAFPTPTSRLSYATIPEYIRVRGNRAIQHITSAAWNKFGKGGMPADRVKHAVTLLIQPSAKRIATQRLNAIYRKMPIQEGDETFYKQNPKFEALIQEEYSRLEREYNEKDEAWASNTKIVDAEVFARHQAMSRCPWMTMEQAAHYRAGPLFEAKVAERMTVLLNPFA